MLQLVVPQNWVVANESNMKIFEVAPDFLNEPKTRPDFVSGEAGVLMTILQHLQSQTDPGTPVPTDNVLNLLANTGFHLTYPELDNLVKNNQNLSQLITNMTPAQLIIGNPVGPETEPEDADQAANTVDQMASRAATL
jgi:hypothetical protein